MQRKFKMERVLEIRQKALEKEKIKFADLQRKDAELAEEMNSIANNMKAKTIEMEEEKAQGRYDFVQLYAKFIKVLEGDFIEVAQKRENLNKEIMKQKVILNKALNDLKIMEKLKEKHKENYNAFVKKQEANQIDELNITRQFKED